MAERQMQIDPAEELADQIARFHEEQRELGIERPILPKELQVAYDGLSDATRKELAKRSLQALSRTAGETHIWPMPNRGGEN